MSEQNKAHGPQQKNGGYYILVIACVLLMFGGRFIPPFAAEITPAGMGVLGVFVGVVILWSSVGGAIWPSLLAVVALGCTGYTTVTGAVASSLGSFMVFNMICVTAMTSALTASGADMKIARWLISRKAWEGRPYLFTFVFLFAFFLISAVTFAFAMIFICWTILRKMAEEMGVTMRHSYFVTMTIYSVVATSLGEFVIPLKSWQYALCSAFVRNSGGVNVDFGMYIVTTFLLGVVVIALLVLTMRPLFKVDLTPVRNYRSSSLAGETNRLNGSQLAIIIVLVVSMLLSIGTNYLQGDGLFARIISTLSLPGIFGVAVVILCAVKDRTGKPVLEFGKVMNGMVWGPILLVGVATCLSSALTAADCGFMAFFARTLLPMMEGKSVFLVYAFVIISACVLTNVASNMGIGMMMIPIAVPICMAANCNMNVAAMVCIYSSCYGFILPGSAATSPLMYSNGDLTKREILSRTSFVVLLYVVIGCIVFPALDAVLPRV